MIADIVKVSAFALVCVLISLFVKKEAPAFSVIITVVGSVIVIFMVMPSLRNVLSTLDDAAGRIGADGRHISILLKIVGIAYIAEFAAQICADAGESSMAVRVELAGKIFIMAAAAPIIMELLSDILRYV